MVWEYKSHSASKFGSVVYYLKFPKTTDVSGDDRSCLLSLCETITEICLPIPPRNRNYFLWAFERGLVSECIKLKGQLFPFGLSVRKGIYHVCSRLLAPCGHLRQIFTIRVGPGLRRLPSDKGIISQNLPHIHGIYVAFIEPSGGANHMYISGSSGCERCTYR